MHPFFAQYRAFYIILAYQRRSTELDSALSLLVVMGFGFLLTVYFAEMEMSFERLAEQIYEKISIYLVYIRHGFSSSDALNEELLANEHHLDSMVSVIV